MAKKTGLSQQHKRFVAAYRRLRNATRAYAEVYPNASHSTCDSASATLMADHRILKVLEALDDVEIKRYHMRADEVLAESGNIARTDHSDYLWAPGERDSAGNETQAGTYKPIHEMTPALRRTIMTIKRDILGNIEIVPWNKTAQIANILKHHRLISDKIDLVISDDLAEAVREARERRKGK